ncbi:MAG: hypothetical protein ACOY4Q_09555 [Bacillota bacterium]
MGYKKKLAARVLKEAVRNRGFRGYFKKILVIVAVFGVLLLIGTAFVVGYGINRVSQMAANRPHPEIVALEKAVSDKTVVLTPEQKTELAPLLKQLIEKEQLPEEAQRIKSEILAVLDAKQLAAVKSLEETIKTEAQGLIDAGISTIEEPVNKYTGISIDDGQRLLKSLLAWWQVNVMNNNVPQSLLKEIESSQ